jgi:pimeloyl-ACP methyl ester carboxylesterase
MDLFQHLVDSHGLRIVFMEYRGYGNNENLGRPNLTKVLNDAEDIYSSLAISDDRMIVMGRSIGTIPAVHLAGKHPNLGALVLDSGMQNPLEGVRKSEANDPPLDPGIETRLKSHQSNVQAFQGTLLQLHCSDDQVFPGEHALTLFRVAAGQGEAKTTRLTWGSDSTADLYQHARATLVLFDAGGHNYIWALNWYLYSQEVLEFLVGSPNGSWWPKKEKPQKQRSCTIL